MFLKWFSSIATNATPSYGVYREFESHLNYQISTSDLTLATEEVRDLWQVRVGDKLLKYITDPKGVSVILTESFSGTWE